MPEGKIIVKQTFSFHCGSTLRLHNNKLETIVSKKPKLIWYVNNVYRMPFIV
jgi:hypothetical protein